MKITLAILFALTAFVSAAIPKPDRYFTDNSHLITDDRGNAINEKLAQFERDTSNQVLVYLTPELPDGDAAAYCTQLMHEWGVGRAGKSNGVGLFIFTDKRIASLQVGYGLEGVLPDATAYAIRKETLNPLWKTKDYAGALDATTDRIIQTIKGEYKGDGKTVAQQKDETTMIWAIVIIGGIVVLMVIVVAKSSGSSGGSSYSSYDSGGSSFGSGGGGSGWGGGGGDCGGGGSSGGMD